MSRCSQRFQSWESLQGTRRCQHIKQLLSIGHQITMHRLKIRLACWKCKRCERQAKGTGFRSHFVISSHGRIVSMEAKNA